MNAIAMKITACTCLLIACIVVGRLITKEAFTPRASQALTDASLLLNILVDRKVLSGDWPKILNFSELRGSKLEKQIQNGEVWVVYNSNNDQPAVHIHIGGTKIGIVKPGAKEVIENGMVKASWKEAKLIR